MRNQVEEDTGYLALNCLTSEADFKAVSLVLQQTTATNMNTLTTVGAKGGHMLLLRYSASSS